jgi:putative phosphoesterase
MILGILSDTHDRERMMAAGIRALRQAGAEFFIHCGDVGGQGVLDLLAGLPAAFVWGNNDFDRRTFARYAAAIEIQCLDTFGRLELGGKSIAVTHGDDFRLIKRILTEQRDDYLLLGHTHVQSDHKEGRVRVINPGALYRAVPKTVATLDTVTDQLTFLTVP